MNTTLAIILILVVFVVGCCWMVKSNIDKLWATLRELNIQHGTAFGTSPKDSHTVIGNFDSGLMAFDQKNRKIAYIIKSGKSVEILDYKIIRRWHLVWDETTYAGGGQIGFAAYGSSRTRRHNAVLIIETNDLRRPIIKLPMVTVGYAENAQVRLNILING